jgi:WD40 repeat protein
VVNAAAAAVMPDGTLVAVSGGDDQTVRVWRLADGTPVGVRPEHERGQISRVLWSVNG